MSGIIVYGRGKTGQSLLKMAQKLGLHAVAYDDATGFDCNENFRKDKTVVLSPGVRPNASGVTLAENVGANLVSELDFCFPHCLGQCVSVTGTNGKTTTCELVRFVLQKANKRSRLLGNGGVPFAEQVLDTKPDEIVVLESSSFQLARTDSFAPYISVLTNVAPDHLDYHDSFENYVSAKRNNFVHQKSSSFAVFNADDPLALQLSADSPAFTCYYSLNNRHANCYYDGDTVRLNLFGAVCNYKFGYLKTLPKHDVSNALCAILVCNLLGVDVAACCNAIAEFSFLPHRLQKVAFHNGVLFVDDSKATNTHATASALDCYQNVPLALIMGGSYKGENFDRLFDDVRSNVRLVCAVGGTSQKIADAASRHGVCVCVCESYREAVAKCYRRMKNLGGVVIMSNACASFDLFANYVERGEEFVKLVGELISDEKN